MKKLFIVIVISTLIFGKNSLLAMEDTIVTETPHGIASQALTWKFLNDDDDIEIIAPSAAPLKLAQIEAAKKLIGEHRLEALVSEEMLKPEASPYNYYANSHEERAKEFIKALHGPSKAVWALLGGFGAAEVVDILERSSFSPPQHPKPILGFSDITALHLLADTWGWPSLHTPVLGLGKELFSITQEDVNHKADLNSVIKILKGELTELEYNFEVIYPGNLPTETLILGSVMGGNLSIIENHSGTKTALKGKDRFVFLEDTPEDGKRLNRHLINLARTGVFDEAKGIIIGYLSIEEFENSPQTTKDAIHHFVKQFLLPRGINIPVVYSPRFGHGAYNDVLPLGTTASLRVHGEQATLKVSVNKVAHKQ